MKPCLLSLKPSIQLSTLSRINRCSPGTPPSSISTVIFNTHFKSSRIFTLCCCSHNNGGDPVSESPTQFHLQVSNPTFPSFVPLPKLSLSDQAFFLLAFIACSTSVAFTSLVLAAVSTLSAMGRTAISLSKLADTACEELPSTMAAIRLSGMEVSDLTLELNDLSQEIADGVNKSAQAVQAAEAGIRQIGSLARHQTMSMIQERANLPVISLKPVVAGAAKKTSHAFGHATKTFMGIILPGDKQRSDDKGGQTMDRSDI